MVDLLLAKGATNPGVPTLYSKHDWPLPTGKEYAKVIVMLQERFLVMSVEERFRFKSKEETLR